jgi:hypothetical protein
VNEKTYVDEASITLESESALLEAQDLEASDETLMNNAYYVVLTCRHLRNSGTNLGVEANRVLLEDLAVCEAETDVGHDNGISGELPGQAARHFLGEPFAFLEAHVEFMRPEKKA